MEVGVMCTSGATLASEERFVGEPANEGLGKDPDEGELQKAAPAQRSLGFGERCREGEGSFFLFLNEREREMNFFFYFRGDGLFC
jgi:hypothetical protein